MKAPIFPRWANKVGQVLGGYRDPGPRAQRAPDRSHGVDGFGFGPRPIGGHRQEGPFSLPGRIRDAVEALVDEAT